MSRQIVIPLVKGLDAITPRDIASICDLIDDEDDRIVTDALLFALCCKTPDGRISLSGVAAGLAEVTAAERRGLLDKMREEAGLEPIAESERKNWERLRTPDHRPLELMVSPSGALISNLDIEDGIAEEQARATSLAAQRAAQAAERALEAEQRRAHQAARDDELRRLTPPGIPTP
jgi:hypothetical protein